MMCVFLTPARRPSRHRFDLGIIPSSMIRDRINSSQWLASKAADQRARVGAVHENARRVRQQHKLSALRCAATAAAAVSALTLSHCPAAGPAPPTESICARARRVIVLY